MIGRSVRSAATRFCSSRPLRPGREMSSTRQLGVNTRGRSRNSCAEAKVSGCQPSSCIKVSSDSRTHTSSSTTNTMGLAVATSDDPTSLPSVLAKLIVLPHNLHRWALHSPSRAALTASSKASSLNGLYKNFTAPCLSARFRMSSSF